MLDPRQIIASVFIMLKKDPYVLIRIEFLVIAISGLFLVMFIMDFRRNRSHASMRKAILKVLDGVSDSMVVYTLGAMQGAPFRNQLFPVWAMVVVSFRSSIDYISGQDSRGLETGNLMRPLGLAFLNSRRGSELKVQLWTLWGVMVLRSSYRMLARSMVSTSWWNGHSVEVITEYMRVDHEDTNLKPDACNPSTMESDDGTEERPYSPPTEDEVIAYNNFVTNPILSSSVDLSSTPTPDDFDDSLGAAVVGLGGSTPPPAPLPVVQLVAPSTTEKQEAAAVAGRSQAAGRLDLAASQAAATEEQETAAVAVRPQAAGRLDSAASQAAAWVGSATSQPTPRTVNPAADLPIATKQRAPAAILLTATTEDISAGTNGLEATEATTGPGLVTAAPDSTDAGPSSAAVGHQLASAGHQLAAAGSATASPCATPTSGLAATSTGEQQLAPGVSGLASASEPAMDSVTAGQLQAPRASSLATAGQHQAPSVSSPAMAGQHPAPGSTSQAMAGHHPALGGSTSPASGSHQQASPGLVTATVEAALQVTGATTPPSTSTTAAVPVAPIKELRRSCRNAAMADVHTLHRAEWLTAKKNLEFPGNSFANLPDSTVISNLDRIGVNIGSSDVTVLKNIEVDRLVVRANQKKSIQSKYFPIHNNDDYDDQLEALLDHACGDPNEALLDTEKDQILDLSPIQRKKKYPNAKSTARGRFPSNLKPPPKLF